jgi:hypothetical protein
VRGIGECGTEGRWSGWPVAGPSWGWGTSVGVRASWIWGFLEVRNGGRPGQRGGLGDPGAGATHHLGPRT